MQFSYARTRTSESAIAAAVDALAASLGTRVTAEVFRLAKHENPKIRESVASSYHTPADVVLDLASDRDPGVRACLARNESTPCDVLRELARDESEAVRGWVAVNFAVPADVMADLADDPSPVVRGLVAWKATLAESAEQQLVEA